MSSTQNVVFSKGFAEAANFGQENFARLSRGYECLMKGMINVAAQQAELGRGLMQAGMEDFGLLAQAKSPEAFLQAEMEIFRRGSERAFDATRKLGLELNKTLTEASGLGS